MTVTRNRYGLYNIFKTAQVHVTRTISFTLPLYRLPLLFLQRRRQPLPLVTPKSADS